MQEMLNIFIVCIVSVVLAICTYTDIKTHTLFLPLILSLPVLTTFYWLVAWHPEMLLYALWGMILGTLPYFILALAGKGGGGDAILMGCIGFAIGILNIIYLIIFTSALYVLFLLGVIIARKANRKSLDSPDQMSIKKIRYPYAPFVLSGWVVFMIFSITVF